MSRTLRRRIISKLTLILLLTCLLSLSIVPFLEVPSTKSSAQGIQPENPIDEARLFVRQNYLDFLNRNPDPAGLAFWSDQIAACGSDLACVADRRINVSAAFFISIEFQSTGYLVHRLYRASYARLPTLGEFLPDTQTIGRGVVVNAAGWEQLLENNKVAFINTFVASQSFIDLYNSRTNLDYVNTLFANAGVTPTPAERDALVTSLNGGTGTRAGVLRKVADNPVFFRQEYNRAFVQMQYFGYLRRNANDPPDMDFSGLTFWLNKLNQFSLPGEDVTDSNVALSRVRRAEMVKAFIISGEYRGRFIPKPGTKYTLFGNRNDPLLLRAEPPSGEVIEYYGEKNDQGLATSVKSFRIQAASGQATSYLLDQQARPTQINTPNGVTLKLSWQANQVIVVTAISADGVTQVNTSVNMGGGAASSQVNPASAPVPDRRFSRVVTQTPAPPSNELAPPIAPETSPSNSLVTVKRCSLPINDASVHISVSAGLQSGLFPGTFVGDGVYRVSLPGFDSDAGTRIREKCESITGILDIGCTALEILGPAVAIICPALAVAVAAIPGGALVAVAIGEACVGSLAGLELYCATLGAGPGPGGPSISDFICPLADHLDRAPTSPVDLRAFAFIPGKGSVSSSTVTAPAAGPFPNFNITTAESVTIASFTVNPVNPAEGQSYTAAAQISCAAQNTQVTVSISGTDGYQNSTSCTITGTATCSLLVPGAASGVVDTLTVRVTGGPTRTIVNVFR
jgi:hypothetical protein